ncbi:MAG: hypothetical protein LBO02_02080, partial [Holosporaceae bacterium]|nr:hypothetical protein [Holosporaceae bacterium]
MNFLLNLGNLFAEQEIISAAVSIFLSLAILTSFSLSKKFVNAEFNKIDKQSDDQLERIIVLASGAALSALI